uniref:Putative villin-1 isoform X1 n=1 Tax=Davidia involucrata TaxID=16924 RepID=A0A5B7BTK7_DAVIN
MSFFNKDIDSAFQGAGAKAGLEIWCIENLRLVPVPKSSHGKLFSGSAYIILNTFLLKSGTPQYDIHYWLGNDAKEVDSALASDKALELDAALGSNTVQYREVQGQETEKFLSYFKPCIIPIEGVFSSGTGHVNHETYQVRLLTCKGDRVVHVKEVPFTRSSLNHNDVFVLDTASKIFLFSGCNSSIQERAKALEVVQYINENKHSGNCGVATIDDGKFVGDPDVGEFWNLFGGYAPIPRDSPSAVQEHPEISAVKLLWITTQGKLCESGTGTLNKELLSSNKCYMLDCDTEIFVWMGRSTSVTERKTSISVVEDFLRSQGRSIGIHLTFLTERSETALFRSYFAGWPETVEPKLYEDGRGKVAAIFKQQGYDVKELPEEDSQPFMDCSGTLKVWRVNGDELSLVPLAEQTKIFRGDCYIVQYIYPGNGREENLFFVWLGRKSVMEDRADAISHMNTIVNSTKGDPVLAQIVEGREPIQFFLIFQKLIIFKGGMSTRYKSSIAEKGFADDTYDGTKTALFRVQGTSPLNMQAIQVDPVSSSLNSSYCYILKSETSIFTWVGNLSSTRDHDLLDRMLDLINPTWQPILVREGSEPDVFWNALGGKTEYPREKEIKGYIEDPHLFTCTLTESDFKVKEIFNFSQDDLTTEDVLVLNCHREIYVWIGRHSHVESKQQALTLGLKFLEKDILVEGLSLETPIYVVTEGYEPPFFTRFFEWDSSKANMLGNSFERKLAILKGKAQKLEAPQRSSWKAYSMETTPNGLRSRSVGPNGLGRSSSPASNVSGSSFKSSDNRRFSSPMPIRNLFSVEVPSPSSGNAGVLQFDQREADVNLLIYPYERLKVVSNDPVTGIDVTKREAYLSDEEFQEKFEMSKRAFYELPKWKQNKLKMSLHLF